MGDSWVTRKDWWLWLCFLVAALLLHAMIPACMPRCEFMTFRPTNADVLRSDRWTGDYEHSWIIDRGVRGGMVDPLPIPLPLPG